MTTQVVFNVDKKIKDKAMKRAKSEGVPFASVLKFATKAFADGRLTVDIGETERFNAKTAKAIRAALRDAEKGENVMSFKSAKKMDDYLLSL